MGAPSKVLLLHIIGFALTLAHHLHLINTLNVCQISHAWTDTTQADRAFGLTPGQAASVTSHQMCSDALLTWIDIPCLLDGPFR